MKIQAVYDDLIVDLQNTSTPRYFAKHKLFLSSNRFFSAPLLDCASVLKPLAHEKDPRLAPQAVSVALCRGALPYACHYSTCAAYGPLPLAGQPQPEQPVQQQQQQQQQQ